MPTTRRARPRRAPRCRSCRAGSRPRSRPGRCRPRSALGDEAAAVAGALSRREQPHLREVAVPAQSGLEPVDRPVASPKGERPYSAMPQRAASKCDSGKRSAAALFASGGSAEGKPRSPRSKRVNLGAGRTPDPSRPSPDGSSARRPRPAAGGSSARPHRPIRCPASDGRERLRGSRSSVTASSSRGVACMRDLAAGVGPMTRMRAPGTRGAGRAPRDRRDAERERALAERGAAHVDGSVAVSVGLDDRPELRRCRAPRAGAARFAGLRRGRS